MSRNVLLVVLGLGLAAGIAIFLLGDGPADDPYGTGSIDDAAGPDDDPDAAAGLHGTGTDGDPSLLASATPGTEFLEGRVLDPDGQPVVDMEVTAHFTSPAFDDAKATAAYHNAARTLARQRERFQRPAPAPATGTARTDETGTFRIEGLRRGVFSVRAHPDPLLLSPQVSSTISHTWPSPKVVIQLMLGTRLDGKVLDAKGLPVAAFVEARWSGKGATGFNPRRFTADPVRSAEETGVFAIPAVPDGKLVFTVTVPGKLRVSGFSAETPAKTPVILRLPDGDGELAGTVTDQQGGAIPGAEVQITVVSGGGPKATVSTTTGSDGSYVLSGLPTGAITAARVIAIGYAIQHTLPPLAAWSGQAISNTPQTLNFTLLRGGTVEGTVSAVGGAPLEGATVHVFVTSTALGYAAPAPLEAQTNSAGAYRLEGVPAGRLIVVATHPTHYIKALGRSTGANATVVSPGMRQSTTSPAPFTLVMPIDGSTLEKDLEMVPGLKVQGIVQGPDGTPIEGAAIRFKNLQAQQTLQRWGVQLWYDLAPPVQSDAQGEFSFEALPPNDGWELYAKKVGFASKYADPVKVSADQPTPHVTLELVRGATVQGRVVDAGGDPVSGAMVNMWGATTGLAGGPTNTTSDGQGAFEITGLPAGDFNLWVQHGLTGMFTAGPQHRVEGLKEGEVRAGLEFTLKSTGSLISGRIVDEQGAGVAGLSLQLQMGTTWNQTRTQADGTFQIGATNAGRGKLRVPGGKLLGEVDAPSSDVEFTYAQPPATVIEGVILDTEGQPVPLAVLVISGRAVRTDRGLMPTTVSSSNEVVYGKFRRVVKGTAPFKISVTGARDAQGQPANLAPYRDTLEKAPAGPIEIRMEAGEEISGVVVGPTGSGVEGVTVTAGGIQARTDRGGNFRIGGLSGSVTLQFAVPKGFVKPATQKAEAGATLRIELAKGLAIGGTVFTGDGAQMKSGWVNANWAAGDGHAAGNANGGIQANGQFLIEGIPAGAQVRATVSAPWTNGKQAHAPKTVKGILAGTMDLAIHLAVSVSVSGSVFDAAGRPFTAGWVFAKKMDGSRAGGMQRITPEGRFTISGLEPGEYDVGVQLQTGSRSGEMVRVVAPATGVLLRMPNTVDIKGHLEGGDLAGFRVSARRVSGTASTIRGALKPDGSFTISNVPEDGTWVVTAVKRDAEMYAESSPVRAGAAGLRLKLRQGETISGRVTSSGTAAVEQVWVMCKQDSGFQTWTRTTKDGSFTVRGLPPGTYKLQTLQTGQALSSTVVEVETGATGVELKN